MKVFGSGNAFFPLFSVPSAVPFTATTPLLHGELYGQVLLPPGSSRRSSLPQQMSGHHPFFSNGGGGFDDGNQPMRVSKSSNPPNRVPARVIATAKLISGRGKKRGNGILVVGKEADIHLYRQALRQYPKHAVIFSNLLYADVEGSPYQEGLTEDDFQGAPAIMEIEDREVDGEKNIMRTWIAARGFYFGTREAAPNLELLMTPPDMLGKDLTAYHSPIKIIADASLRQLILAEIQGDSVYPSEAPEPIPQKKSTP